MLHFFCFFFCSSPQNLTTYMAFNFAYTELHIDWLIIDLYCNIKWEIFQLHLLKEHKNIVPSMQTVDTHLKVFFTMVKKLDYINTIQLLRVDKNERDHYYFFKIHTIDSKTNNDVWICDWFQILFLGMFAVSRCVYVDMNSDVLIGHGMREYTSQFAIYWISEYTVNLPINCRK